MQNQVDFEQLANVNYNTNAILAIFCSSSYITSLAGRILLYFNTVMIGINRVNSGAAPITSIVVNFFVISLVIESVTYKYNQERVRLFLMTEVSKQ